MGGCSLAERIRERGEAQARLWASVVEDQRFTHLSCWLLEKKTRTAYRFGEKEKESGRAGLDSSLRWGEGERNLGHRCWVGLQEKGEAREEGAGLLGHKGGRRTQAGLG
jgi:hypothetical protein